MHAAPDIKVGFGLTAVMGRMFTSGSNAQIVNFAKSRANGNIGNVPGPLLPLFPILRRCSAARHSGHSLRLQKFLCAILRLATFNAANMVLES